MLQDCGHGSKFGKVNYSVDEIRQLNVAVRSLLPLASEIWMHVAYRFNYLRPEGAPFRSVESLKRKFKKMCCTQGPTLPDYVKEAKELRKRISGRVDKVAIDMTEEAEGKETVRDLALKLKQMEEEYHRTQEENKRTEAASSASLGVIEVSRQRDTRRRCYIEEQMPGEIAIARVRREHKRHKRHKRHETEQGLAENGNDAASENEEDLTTSLDSRTKSALVPSLGVMRLVLQFMATHQVESAQRIETEQAHRDRERREREERRRRKTRRRRQEQREIMFVMKALLCDRFPDSLKHCSNDGDY